MADDTWGASIDGDFPWFNLDDFDYPQSILETDMTITVLKPFVLNQQPAHMSALADPIRELPPMIDEGATSAH